MPFPLDSPYADCFFEIEVGPVLGPTQSDQKRVPYCKGFICDDDGTVTIIGKGDPSNTPIVIPVLKGVRYDFAAKEITAISGPTTVIGFV